MKVSQFPGLSIGQRVYLIVTPSTKHLFGECCYRPKPYFVLEAKVKDITGDGTYRFSTDYFVHADRLLTRLTDAKVRLTEIFNDDTDGFLAYGKVLLVTSDKEKGETERQDNKIAATVAKSQEPLRAGL